MAHCAVVFAEVVLQLEPARDTPGEAARLRSGVVRPIGGGGEARGAAGDDRAGTLLEPVELIQITED